IRPAESLDAFYGADANGPWTLTVVDSTPRDVGSLVGWSLSFAGEPVAVSNPDGTFALPPAPGGGAGVRGVPPPTYAPLPDEVAVQWPGTVSIGLVRVQAIYGRVQLDNGDQTYGPWDGGFAGAVVYVDQNGDGTFDPSEPSTVTDRYGHFVFTGLA